VEAGNSRVDNTASGDVGSICLIRSRVRSAVTVAFSLLTLINAHGLIWMPACLPDTSLWSLLILIDRFRALYHVFKKVLLLKITQIGASKVVLMLHLMYTSFTSSFLQMKLDRKDVFSGRSNLMLSSESVFQ
jgi:hypothetical protein